MKKNHILSSLNILSIAGVLPYKLKHNEKYMNHKQISHFKVILESWCKKLKNKKNITMNYMKNKTINFPDLIDRAVQEEEFNLTLRTQEREQKLIKQIEYTLKKINTNGFGYCDLCGIEIGIKRLEASPIANLCIDCKTLSEIREKQIIE
ncbi:RNA polymerase-binding protein DksA [Enterobacteriaceae endosymbiont of Neohaemonia nigricornis]|uniref:RNA polymerase-binding protein DksA n=1 Tax=Enterobacteriaceae endosymbiont of Neohaemonia nigricornis TaxID=2675792 RepID=UPI00144A1000|nr:RNA polymerase-binding protein DksA [Enterobacteriaceae endosymbiont of Neohaemonia nigricornis]QJC30436.1 RNA polymerase-binding protein DksA [Enterobacteriaceae endosymbiont of Neohaemonia nigricornis]